MNYEGLVCIMKGLDDKIYYARWSRVLRKRTHLFVSDNLRIDLIEPVRTNPDSLEVPDA